ncbi:ABC transporter substrate-binding protein [Hwanghaeella sp.]|uniref:ABC transporter substrate-binding protein n=1 Tax=Hwanghaeella sp. TaxID=2605943 RepID=UPI003CCC2987
MKQIFARGRRAKADRNPTKHKMLVVLAAAIFGSLLSGSLQVQAADEITVTDLAGREVTLAAPVKAIILGEGRYLPSIGILDRDNPLQRIAGMMGDFELFDPAGYKQFADHFPKIDSIPRVGKNSAATMDIESVAALMPDLAIFGLGGGHSPGEKHTDIIEKLEAAGIPVIFIDFRIEPLENTPKSMRLLGKVMGRQTEAEDFLTFYREQLDKVAKRLEDIEDKPSVFMELHVGLKPECCNSIGNQMLGRMVDFAGGKNIFADAIPGSFAAVSVEELLVRQPDIYIGSAIGSVLTADQFPKRIVLGSYADKAVAELTLAQIHERTGLKSLDAVKANRVHAIWHHFYNSPMHFALIQTMAKWFHPDLFADLSPEQSLTEFYHRFQPLPMNGTYWVSLGGGQ